MARSGEARQRRGGRAAEGRKPGRKGREPREEPTERRGEATGRRKRPRSERGPAVADGRKRPEREARGRQGSLIPWQLICGLQTIVIIVLVALLMQRPAESGDPDIATSRPATSAASVSVSGPAMAQGGPIPPRDGVDQAHELPAVARATLDRIVDGDTIKVWMGGKRWTVRYLGIDTPETKKGVEFMGKEASARNARLSRGELVIEFDGRRLDRFDRLLAYVYQKDAWKPNFAGKSINEQLLEEGLAEVYRDAPYIKNFEKFKAIEKRVRQARKGVWNEDAKGQWHPPIR